MNTFEPRNALFDVSSLIYASNPSPEKDEQAIALLRRFVGLRVPEAINLYAVLLWHGFGVKQDLDQAFAFASQALAPGNKDALLTLGAMQFVGAGCEPDFKKALAYYHRFSNESNAPPRGRIGKVSLSYFEFRSEFKVNVNGNLVEGDLSFLDELNHWVFVCKKKCCKFQEDVLAKNPEAYGGISTRRLPFQGSIGGSCFCLRGKESITDIGMRYFSVNEEVWFRVDRLVGWPRGIGFDALTSFEDLPHQELAAVSNVFLANRSRAKTFELWLIGSSVHRETRFFCGGEEIFSAFED